MAAAVTTTQYGVRYPDGTIQWADGSLNFDRDGQLGGAKSLARFHPRKDNQGYPVELDAATTSAATAGHFKSQLREVAETAGVDIAEHLQKHTIVSRQVVVTVLDTIDCKLAEPTEDVPF